MSAKRRISVYPRVLAVEIFGYTLEPLLHVVLAFLCVPKKKIKSYRWSDMAKRSDMEIRS